MLARSAFERGTHRPLRCTDGSRNCQLRLIKAIALRVCGRLAEGGREVRDGEVGALRHNVFHEAVERVSRVLHVRVAVGAQPVQHIEDVSEESPWLTAKEQPGHQNEGTSRGDLFRGC